VKIGRFAIAAGLCGCVLVPAIGQRAASYHDPAGRYTLQIPQGWNTTQMNSDAVQFASGAAYITMLVLPGADPVSMMNSIGTQTGKQWKNFAQARRGDANFGGRAGQYVVYSGINPMGADSYLQMLAVTEGSATYLLMTSAPKPDFTRLKSEFDQIEQSFTLTAAAKPADALPPAPYGAIGASKSAGPAAAPAQPPAARAAPAQVPASMPQAKSATAGGGNIYRMKIVRITDQTSFERPMTALTMLIPADWQFQGSLQYWQGPGCPANLVRLKFQATSPDGRTGIELLPGYFWMWADDPYAVNIMRTSNQRAAQMGGHPCDLMAALSPEAFLRQTVIPAARRGAQVTGVEAMPEAAQQLQQQAAQAQQAAARSGMSVNIRAGVGRVRASYALNGQPEEERFTAIMTSTSVAGPNARGGQTRYYLNSVDNVFGVLAPQGQLDAQEKMFQLILRTLRLDPEWQSRVSQEIAKLNNTDSNAAMAQSAIITKLGQDEAKIIKDTYQNTSNTQEHSRVAIDQAIRGAQSYRNPNTGETVELDNQYGKAWAGPNNQYILSDSPNYNPNQSEQGNWTQMQPVKP
jgi:hypothetical protein